MSKHTYQEIYDRVSKENGWNAPSNESIIESLDEEIEYYRSRIIDLETHIDKNTVPRRKIIKPIFTIGNGILCPKCKAMLLVEQPYCYHCGQPIDWSYEDKR